MQEANWRGLWLWLWHRIWFWLGAWIGERRRSGRCAGFGIRIRIGIRIERICGRQRGLSEEIAARSPSRYDREVAVDVFFDQRRVEALRRQGISPRRQLADEALAPSAPSSPQTALQMVEECARLRAENRRLADEVARLRREIDRLTAPAGRSAPALPPPREERDLGSDDATLRFSLIELDT